MTDPERDSPNAPPHAEGHESPHEMEEYAGGYIQAWVGHIPAWLLAVYAVLFSGRSITAGNIGAV